MPEIAQTADHALRVLEELGQGEPLTAAALCRRLDLNRTVVHRLLTTLEARGFVMRQGSTVVLGPTLVRLAGTVAPDLRVIALPTMRSVARQTGETVVLHVVDGQQAVALEQAVATEHVVRVSQRLGARHPLVAGASGRAVLAFLPPGEVTRALRAAERPDMVVRSLESIRALGYAMSHDELQMGVAGVAVPLLGTDEVAIGSISILVPTGRARDLERHLGTLRQAAAEISGKLGPRASRADDGGAGRR